MAQGTFPRRDTRQKNLPDHTHRDIIEKITVGGICHEIRLCGCGDRSGK